MNKTIRTAIATAAVGGVLLAANPASAAVTAYSTDFTGVTINDDSGWRMANPLFDAEITDGALRISNSYTSGSFDDQLFSPELKVGAVEGSEVDTFTAKFRIMPHSLKKGLRTTVAPDNGDGGRAGSIAIQHTATGMDIESSGSYFRPAKDGETPDMADGTVLDWTVTTVAKNLDPTVAHRVQMTLVKKADTAENSNNDVFSVKVDSKRSINTTYEAYYNATGEDQYETDTLLFRSSAVTAPDSVAIWGYWPAMGDEVRGKGIVIDGLLIKSS